MSRGQRGAGLGATGAGWDLTVHRLRELGQVKRDAAWAGRGARLGRVSARAVPVAARAGGDPPPGGSPAPGASRHHRTEEPTRGVSERPACLRGRLDRLAALATGHHDRARRIGEHRPARVHAPGRRNFGLIRDGSSPRPSWNGAATPASRRCACCCRRGMSARPGHPDLGLGSLLSPGAALRGEAGEQGTGLLGQWQPPAGPHRTAAPCAGCLRPRRAPRPAGTPRPSRPGTRPVPAGRSLPGPAPPPPRPAARRRGTGRARASSFARVARHRAWASMSSAPASASASSVSRSASIETPLRVDGLGEQGDDGCAISAFAHRAERLVPFPQVPLGRGGVPGDQLDLAGQLSRDSSPVEFRPGPGEYGLAAPVGRAGVGEPAGEAVEQRERRGVSPPRPTGRRRPLRAAARRGRPPRRPGWAGPGGWLPARLWTPAPRGGCRFAARRRRRARGLPRQPRRHRHPETQLADQQPRLGQALQVALGFQHRRGRLACLECFGAGLRLAQTWISACRTRIRA